MTEMCGMCAEGACPMPCPHALPRDHARPDDADEPARLAFMFDTGDGNDPAIEASSLAEARSADPSVVNAKLQAVWCLKSCNRVWGDMDGTKWADPA